jgi:primary-amine oxidase
LRAGVDCPEGAAFLDVTQYYDTGDVVIHKNAICVFEKDAAIPVRRHYEMLRGARPHHHHHATVLCFLFCFV